jgi:hypothetical protein
MSVQTAMVAIKTANSTLNTLIGTRFHPDALPQNVTLPAVTFQVISRTREHAFQGRPHLSNTRVQVDGYAATSAARTTLRSALIGAFLPTTRVNGSWGGETLFDIRIENEIEGIEQMDTQTQAYRITMDLIVDIVEV